MTDKKESQPESKNHYARSPFNRRIKASSGQKIIRNSPEETTLYIYDEISWFGVDAGQFIKDLNAIDSKTIHLRLNTPGGSVFDGTAIYNAIKQHKSKVITHIDGLAASIGSLVALAGDEVHMAENAFLMIHEPWSIVIGMADDMRKEAELLDKVGDTIGNVYAKKTGKPIDEIKELMKDETWMTGQEALDSGFIDSIEEDKEEKAKATLFDLSVFANVPDQLKAETETLTVRDLERALRDAGCSSKRAKEILAEGFREEQRDVEQPENPGNGHRDVDQSTQRDVEAKKKDRTADILTRAEMIAPAAH